ncbi:hypothetical protein Bpfe_017975 [Biomphalaria pfeifferi]|uniref:Uncharacterized protein n=1 Tax=Biomphalaria pfeifferi TaxID=112525 RepID=A0AAD8BDR0_BIOPF|nr:hypothetical protein Bpfe_017975 [Biomphalaria pfeifferi]
MTFPTDNTANPITANLMTFPTDNTANPITANLMTFPTDNTANPITANLMTFPTDNTANPITANLMTFPTDNTASEPYHRQSRLPALRSCLSDCGKLITSSTATHQRRFLSDLNLRLKRKKNAWRQYENTSLF